ncbi:1-acyl-sn-glycerol-3-phosphate acyltransferase [Acrocarpospora phusangensis]|uniref:1-acyl-sn-glycerol-3-phosphate acyltransferase n=1 Tax=Acrocarpospora phusangensis TaxID=1070424 RepID=A0A919QB95_9ACTN|nr:lysophospholipid acyltransferase family protein [Acrocarpospora phusangensis]GIH24195.1 1-acyl-sn-glycerol-3-phosphate acyltransferase [Acrocarpospora phusangensis]
MFYRVAKFLSVPAVHLVWRPKVEGLGHVPEQGPAILASNHLSILDSFFLPALLPRRVTFVAKNEYFTSSNPLTRVIMQGNLAIDRDSARAGQEMLDAAAGVLKSGELFGIYPEGTRSPDGRLYKGKIGVAWLALTTGAPVLPVAMIDTERVLPPGASVPRVHRIGVRIGEPMTFTGDPARARDRRQVTDDVMAAIQRLSGQEYVPSYAKRPSADTPA